MQEARERRMTSCKTSRGPSITPTPQSSNSLHFFLHNCPVFLRDFRGEPLFSASERCESWHVPGDVRFAVIIRVEWASYSGADAAPFGFVEGDHGNRERNSRRGLKTTMKRWRFWGKCRKETRPGLTRTCSFPKSRRLESFLGIWFRSLDCSSNSC